MKKLSVSLPVLLLALALGGPAQAAGSMKIFPLNPYFTDSIRSQYVNVVNNSDKPATFRVEFFFEQQTPDGAPIHLKDPVDPALDLRKMIVYSPRQVFLQPGDVQTIKIAIRRPENFPEGESRIYLKLTRLDENGPSVGVGTPVSASDKKSMYGNISVQIGYAIPVIVRHGRADTVAKIEKFTVNPARGRNFPTVNMTISRKGKFGAIGRVSIYATGAGQEERLVGRFGNAYIYPEIDHRDIVVPLHENITSGNLRVVYDGNEEGPDKGIVFDEKTFPVGK